jgi:hypothetical protein
MLQDLNTVPYLDLSKSWWDQTIVEDLTIQDSIFYVCGDISTAVDDFMYCTIFNKELYKQKVTDGTDIYALVNEGKWTLDQLLRLSKLVQEDVNGDGVMDANDKFGLMTWYDELYASVQAAGGRVAQVNEQGNIELCINNARNLDVMVKYMELENSPSTINFQNTSKMVNGAKWSTMFTNDQVLFLMYTLNKLSILRNADTDYGIICRRAVIVVVIINELVYKITNYHLAIVGIRRLHRRLLVLAFLAGRSECDGRNQQCHS